MMRARAADGARGDSRTRRGGSRVPSWFEQRGQNQCSRACGCGARASVPSGPRARGALLYRTPGKTQHAAMHVADAARRGTLGQNYSRDHPPKKADPAGAATSSRTAGEAVGKRRPARSPPDSNQFARRRVFPTIFFFFFLFFLPAGLRIGSDAVPLSKKNGR